MKKSFLLGEDWLEAEAECVWTEGDVQFVRFVQVPVECSHLRSVRPFWHSFLGSRARLETGAEWGDGVVGVGPDAGVFEAEGLKNRKIRNGLSF